MRADWPSVWLLPLESGSWKSSQNGAARVEGVVARSDTIEGNGHSRFTLLNWTFLDQGVFEFERPEPGVE